MLVSHGFFTTTSILQNVRSTLATLVAKTCDARLVADIIVYVNIKIGKLKFKIYRLDTSKMDSI